MSLDITKTLEDWPYKPGQITVRKIRGDDGREKIQLRLDLGLLQMETQGRPDGERPHGQESLLDHYKQKLEAHKSATGSDEGFQLDESDCEKLRAEAAMYYHRYLAEFVLEDYEAVDRDTGRNLKLVDFLSAYAVEESDRHSLEQYRPYMIMMNSRARGQLSLRDNRPRAALAIVKLGINRIREFYKQLGQEELIPNCGEIAVLRVFAKQIQGLVPVDPLRKLRKDLAQAVREERYEDAAQLRDQIRKSHGEDSGPEGDDL